MVFLFVFFIILILLVTSKIQINIKNLKYYVNQNKHSSKYDICIKLIIINTIPILWTNINENKKYKNLNKTKIQQRISVKEIIKPKQNIEIKIKNFYLKAKIGTDNVFFTSIIIPTISSIISIILAKKKTNPKKINYNINPIYNRR